MKNMCVSAGNSMLFDQVRYEHPHQISTMVFSETVVLFYLYRRGSEMNITPLFNIGTYAFGEIVALMKKPRPP